MKDITKHKKRDGRVFQMLDAFTNEPMQFNLAKKNYTAKDYDRLKIGESIKFEPMFGNSNPVFSILLRVA